MKIVEKNTIIKHIITFRTEAILRHGIHTEKLDIRTEGNHNALSKDPIIYEQASKLIENELHSIAYFLQGGDCDCCSSFLRRALIRPSCTAIFNFVNCTKALFDRAREENMRTY